MGKFAEIERYNKVQITLMHGTIHVGESWGIEEVLNDNGEDFEFEYLVFKTDNMQNSLALQEKELLNFKLITQRIKIKFVRGN